MRSRSGFRAIAAVAAMLVALTPLAARPGPVANAAAAGDDTPAYSWSQARTGRLSNGMRYAILPRRGGEAGIGIFLRVEGGFLAERRPGERGLVHLIEHIAFESPTLSAPDDFQHLRHVAGPVTLPAPSAGTTSATHTTYFLSARDAEPATIDTLVGVFREVVSDLTFRADAVDGQRGEVMREMAGRAPGNATYARYIAAIGPGTPNDLVQAQNSDDVPTASVETIRALYHRLYRPEATTLTIVGDVDPAAVEATIVRHFAAWPSPGPRIVPQLPQVAIDRVAPISYSDAPDRTGVILAAILPPLPRTATRADRIDTTLMDMVWTAAVEARLAHARPGAAPGALRLTIDNAEGYRTLHMLDQVGPGEWRAGVAALDRTACALLRDGLTAGEWDEARARAIATLEAQVAAMSDARNVDLAIALGHAAAVDTLPVGPDELLARARNWLTTVSVARGNAWWRDQWQGGAVHLRVETPELAQDPDPIAAIRAARDSGCVAR